MALCTRCRGRKLMNGKARQSSHSLSNINDFSTDYNTLGGGDTFEDI
jgi:hypothetical protein